MARKFTFGLVFVLIVSGLFFQGVASVQAGSPAAFQMFEGGYMIWRGETGEVWIMTFADWQVRVIPQSDYENLPDNPVPDSAPLDFVKPVSGFGRVWGNFPEVRQILGWALVEEMAYSVNFQPTTYSAGGLLQTVVNIPDGREILLREDFSWQFNDGQPRSIWSLHQPIQIPSTIQLFEHGAMMWWTETGSIWVLNSETRQAIHYESIDYGALSDNPVTQAPPAGWVKPIMGFGKVWGHFPAVRQALGWATGPARSYRLSFVRRPADGVFAAEVSHADLGTITITGNTWQGTLPGDPTPIPPASDSVTSYNSQVLSYGFDYPAGWFLQVEHDAGQGIYETVYLTSYDPAEGEPAHAAFADPSLVKMTFFGHSYGDGWTLDAWVNQYKEQVDGVTHQIVSEYTYTLPSGIVAHRMNMRSGTGGYPVLLTVIDGYGITVEGVMADTSWFTRVTSSLRTTR